MKKYLLLISALLIANVALADCNNPQNSFEIQKCVSGELTSAKADLNAVYKKAYNKVTAKAEFEDAQKKWLVYREAQCGTFVSEDTMRSPASASIDMSCQVDLTVQRTKYLKDFLKSY